MRSMSSASESRSRPMIPLSAARTAVAGGTLARRSSLQVTALLHSALEFPPTVRELGGLISPAVTIEHSRQRLGCQAGIVKDRRIRSAGPDPPRLAVKLDS